MTHHLFVARHAAPWHAIVGLTRSVVRSRLLLLLLRLVELMTRLRLHVVERAQPIGRQVSSIGAKLSQVVEVECLLLRLRDISDTTDAGGSVAPEVVEESRVEVGVWEALAKVGHCRGLRPRWAGSRRRDELRLSGLQSQLQLSEREKRSGGEKKLGDVTRVRSVTGGDIEPVALSELGRGDEAAATVDTVLAVV